MNAIEVLVIGALVAVIVFAVWVYVRTAHYRRLHRAAHSAAMSTHYTDADWEQKFRLAEQASEKSLQWINYRLYAGLAGIVAGWALILLVDRL